MITHAYALTLLDYHYWARDRVLVAVDALTPEQYARAIPSSFPSVRETVVHIYFAEWVWYSRWTGTSPTAGPNPATVPDVGTLRAEWTAMERNVRAFVGALGDAGLDRRIEYRLLSGAASSSRFWELLVHLVNHASYHRGQVTTLLRQLGAKPPESTDMVAFFRTRS